MLAGWLCWLLLIWLVVDSRRIEPSTTPQLPVTYVRHSAGRQDLVLQFRRGIVIGMLLKMSLIPSCILPTEFLTKGEKREKPREKYKLALSGRSNIAFVGVGKDRARGSRRHTCDRIEIISIPCKLEVNSYKSTLIHRRTWCWTWCHGQVEAV